MENKTLPDKPSELIRMALTDLVKCEEDPRYQIEMGSWHVPTGGVCEVCLGGAVLAQRFDAPIGEDRDPSSLEISARNKLYALDSFRKGRVAEALCHLKIDHLAVPERFDVTSYEDSPEEFKDDMWGLAQLLEDYGL